LNSTFVFELCRTYFWGDHLNLNNNAVGSNNERMKTSMKWVIATYIAAVVFFALSLRWTFIDNSPPAWDQALYLVQATTLHESLRNGGLVDFFMSLMNVDRGRVPLLVVAVQPAFYFLGPELDVAVVCLNLAWFILAWAIPGIVRQVTDSDAAGMGGFLAFILFGLYPLTILATHNYLVEFLLIAMICGATYALLRLHRSKDRVWSFALGLFTGLGMLTKVTFPAFLFLGVVVILVSNARQYSVKETVKPF